MGTTLPSRDIPESRFDQASHAVALARSFFSFLVTVSLCHQVDADAPAFLPTTLEQSITLPSITPVATPGSDPGYRVTVVTSACRAPDTMRVELQFDSRVGKTTSTKSLLVTLEPIETGHFPPDAAAVIEVPFEIPEGVTTSRTVVHSPKLSYGNAYDVQLRDLDRPRSVDGVVTNGSVGTLLRSYVDALDDWERTEFQPRLLWVNCQQDDQTATQSLIHWAATEVNRSPAAATANFDWRSAAKSGSVNSSALVMLRRDIDQLPLDWRGYQAWDVLVVHQSQWRQWQNGSEAFMTAIRDWVSCGGNLVIRGHESTESMWGPPQDDQPVLDGSKIKDLQRQMQVQRFQSDGTPLVVDETFGRDLIGTIANSLMAFDTGRLVADDGVRLSSYVAGLVIDLPVRAATEPVHVVDWSFVETALRWRISSILRRGSDPTLGNQRFNQWLIPGVSEPPVYTFMGLLGLFVIAVGPIAYRKTTRSGRGYLMFLIAPALAITTTGLMLIYGVLADGLGTQARVRQITWVDGSLGDAATRTRATYFAGIRPADGLTFSNQSDVTIYANNEGKSWEDQFDKRFSERGTISINDDQAGFSSMFLPSRRQQQFVSHRPHREWGRIQVQSAAGSASTIELQSDGAPALTSLIVRDRDGQYFSCRQLDHNATAQGYRMTGQEASKSLGDLFKQQWLVSNNNQSQTRQIAPLNRRRFGRQTYDVMATLQQRFPGTFKPTEGIFETELQQRLQLGSGLPYQSFAAVAELTDDALAMQSAVPNNSLHFVIGSLP
ncbi:MAG: hypothetical protein AAF539_14795 [Planctomycetota bacterium]